jgi:hypothetical protein
LIQAVCIVENENAASAFVGAKLRFIAHLSRFFDFDELAFRHDRFNINMLARSDLFALRARAAAVAFNGPLAIKRLSKGECKGVFSDPARPGHYQSLPRAPFDNCALEQSLYRFVSDKR